MRRRGGLRIIAGHWRRRRLDVAAARGARPTPDRVRETLFNWLTEELAGARCLDLYAGSGALGLEALSRGAERALFVESDARMARALRDVLSRWGAGGASAQVREASALRWLSGEGDRNEAFDLVFMDPPFGKPPLARCCAALEASGRLADEAWIYAEGDSPPEPAPPNWRLHRSGQAGMVHYRLYRRWPAGATGAKRLAAAGSPRVAP